MSSSIFENSSSTCQDEQGDIQINWNLTYITSLMSSAESQLTAIAGLMRSEILKIKADKDFIKDNLEGSHNHLKRLDKTAKELQRLLGQFEALADKSRNIARKAGRRVLDC